MLYKQSIILVFLLVIFSFAQAENASIVQTKTQIKLLDSKINALKQSLAKAHDSHALINKELAVTEKKIGDGVAKLRTIETDITVNQQKIDNLQLTIVNLGKELSAQQDLLAEHIRARYEMGEYRPLKWLLNQNSPQSANRLLTFYQYFIQSRQEIIANIDSTKASLLMNKNSINSKIAHQNILHNHLNQQQQKLEINKKYHTVVIQTLNNDIQSNQQRLNDFEKNKKNLANLLSSLVSQEQSFSNKPFIAAKHKLILPVNVSRNAINSLNQGLFFKAPEGSAVKAIHSGKIVFSDWLNGYGLLVILDHGQGFMSLYAHNQSLLKSKGNIVAPGDQIATVGHSGGGKKAGLYFELRQKGKIIPALNWL